MRGDREVAHALAEVALRNGIGEPRPEPQVEPTGVEAVESGSEEGGEEVWTPASQAERECVQAFVQGLGLHGDEALGEEVARRLRRRSFSAGVWNSFASSRFSSFMMRSTCL